MINTYLKGLTEISRKLNIPHRVQYKVVIKLKAFDSTFLAFIQNHASGEKVVEFDIEKLASFHFAYQKRYQVNPDYNQSA